MSSQYEDWNSKRFGRVITEDELSKRSDPMWPYKYFNPGTPVSKEKVNELVKGGIDVHPAWSAIQRLASWAAYTC